MGFWRLLLVSTMPVIQVLLMIALGAILALQRVNLIGPPTIKLLNKLVVFVFVPALVYSILAETITVKKLAEMWFMPLNILLTHIIGSAFGWIVVKITKPQQNLQGLVIASCTAGNIGNMLVVLIPEACKEKGTPFGDHDSCSKYGMAYASLSMALGQVYMWTYVYFIIKVYSSTGVEGLEDHQLSKHQLNEPAQPQTSIEQTPQVSLWAMMNLKKLFSPAIIATIVGFIVGLISPIRKLLIGDEAPLHVIQDTATLFGNGAIPVITLITGGNLLRGLTGLQVKKTIILSIAIIRFIALPLVGVGVVKGALRIGWVQHNPLYEYVLMIQFALPPALNIGTIAQLFGSGEGEFSVILLWNYALSTIAVTLWSLLFLSVVAH